MLGFRGAQQQTDTGNTNKKKKEMTLRKGSDQKKNTMKELFKQECK